MNQRSGRLLRSLTLAALAGGLLVRIAQYADHGSLWLDEIAVARNVTERAAFDLLTRPLYYQQAAPITCCGSGPSSRQLRR